MDRDTHGVTMPDLMHESSPWLRLILIFREPVDRYYSAFYYYRYILLGGSTRIARWDDSWAAHH